MSLPSSPSDSSVLALDDFTYGRGVHEVEYPHDHDQSQPQSPASARSPFPRRSHARAYSISSIERAHLSSQPKHNGEHAVGEDEEYGLGFEGRKGADDGHMDPFSKGELAVMGGSTLMVLGLICVAATLTLGKVHL